MLDWLKGLLGWGKEPTTTGGGGGNNRGLWTCPWCNSVHGPVCPTNGKRITDRKDVLTGNPKNPVVERVTFSIQPWAIGTALVIAAGGAIYVISGLVSGGGTFTPALVAIGAAGAAGAGSADAATPGSGGNDTSVPGGLTGSVSGGLPGAPGTQTKPTGIRTNPEIPGKQDTTIRETWVRKGPTFQTGDDLRKPKYLEVGNNSLTYSTEKDGKNWTNTLTWSTPPESLQPGDTVTLTFDSTSQEGWGNVGGWWNINCQKDGKGEAGAGSAKGWRAADPHRGTYTFIFNPKSDKPFMQVSAGHEPVRDQWVLVTWNYERAPAK